MLSPPIRPVLGFLLVSHAFQGELGHQPFLPGREGVIPGRGPAEVHEAVICHQHLSVKDGKVVQVGYRKPYADLDL